MIQLNVCQQPLRSNRTLQTSPQQTTLSLPPPFLYSVNIPLHSLPIRLHLPLPLLLTLLLLRLLIPPLRLLIMPIIVQRMCLQWMSIRRLRVDILPQHGVIPSTATIDDVERLLEGLQAGFVAPAERDGAA